jgi:uncharacterized protein with von Willebrand factor type A (vWA) domain
MMDDLALRSARFGAALRAAGVPADPGRCERFARAVTIARPATTQALYLCALATLTSGPEQAAVLRRVFSEVFGGLPAPQRPGEDERAGRPPGAVPPVAEPPAADLAEAARAARSHAGPGEGPGHGAGTQDGAGGDARPGTLLPVPHEKGEPPAAEEPRAARPVLASSLERLAGRDFADLSAAELQSLAGLMAELTLALPQRRSRRARRRAHGGATDLRATLRQARRTGGHPLALAHRAPLMEPRHLVVLCDISGSMEPYARAMLQFLYCAAGGVDAEVFTFATRLTRLTRVLARVPATVAVRRAGESAPDWLGGTRIGESLREFNDRFGRRGMARGAVVVVISDGWDTGDPGVLRREMERLSRVAHRIVWVNPRTQHPQYQPLAGGMAAAWPFCDAVVSGHSVQALAELAAALAHPGQRRGTAPGLRRGGAARAGGSATSRAQRAAAQSRPR